MSAADSSLLRQAVDAGAEVAQKTAGRAQAGMNEINQNLVEILNQQARHNVQLFQTLAQPSNWGKAAQLHNEFLRTSWQRAAQFAQRYVEVSQTVMASTLSTARTQATKA